MKNKLHIQDSISILTGKSQIRKERLMLAGEVQLQINGKTVFSKNNIELSLLGYLAESMEDPEEGHIRNDYLFDAENFPPGSIQIEKDGIAYLLGDDEDSAVWNTMVTTSVLARSLGIKYKGTATVHVEGSGSPESSPSPSDVPTTFIHKLVIGRGYGKHEDHVFEFPFAYKDSDDIELELPKEVADGDAITVEWEIYLVPLD